MMAAPRLRPARVGAAAAAAVAAATAALVGLLATAQGAAAFAASGAAAGATPALSSILNPAIDTCAADPAGWVQGPVPVPASVGEILTPRHNATFLWGTYQPNQYFCVKSRTAPATLASGILWHGPGMTVEQARSECRQEDGINKYGWTQHDGRYYGRQAIDDASQGVALVTEYARLDLDSQAKEQRFWASRVQVTPQGQAAASEEDDEEDEDDEEGSGPRHASWGPRNAAVYLYLGIDCDGAVPAEDCLAAAGSGNGLSIQIDRSRSMGAAFIRGSTAALGDFTLEVGISQAGKDQSKQQKAAPLSISYWGASGVVLADLKSRLVAEQGRSLLAQAMASDSPDKAQRAAASSAGALPDTVFGSSNVIVIRVAAAGPFTVDAVLRATTEEEKAADEDDEDYEPGTEDVGKIKAVVDAATGEGLAAFHARFQQVFQLADGAKGYKGRPFTKAEVEAAQAAFSNLIGGVGYFHGRVPIKGPDGTTLKSFPTQLFTAVPSRSFFPRGFLWDEGFHQLLAHKWDLALTYDVVLHWLSQMHAHEGCPDMGWIPREIALGEQAVRRIPQEFLPQSVDVANPPTFLLTLEKVLSLTEDNAQCEPSRSTAAGGGGGEQDKPALLRRPEFLRTIQSRLDMWVRWLLSSQRGPVPGSFRWRGRGDPGEKLMATTFASGLDDYPRASEPGVEEYHVDLLCWVIKGCQILSRLAAAIDQGETSARYATVADELLASLDSLHWNETLGGYFDYGMHSEDGFFDETFPVRCGDPATRTAIDIRVQKDLLYQYDPERNPGFTPCPPEYPVVVNLLSRDPELSYVRGHVLPQHVPRVGYVSLFPFLLGLLPPDSPRLGPILATLRDPEQLWSPYGIRSLSKADPFYQRENAPGDAPYWRGYIWINANYLTLRALWNLSRAEGSPYQAQAKDMYTELRDNLLTTILGNYERTGYFWEQYHDGTGQGMRCHPFTGWTALVVNIMAEDY